MGKAKQFFRELFNGPDAPRVNLRCYCTGCKVGHPSQPRPGTDMFREIDNFRMKHTRPTCKLEVYSNTNPAPRGLAGTPLDRLWQSMERLPYWIEHPDFAHNANILLSYTSNNVMAATGFNSLATSSTFLAGWATDAIDNTSNLYLDYEIGGFTKTGTSPAASTEVDLYFYWISNATYPDTITGSNGTFTLTNSNILNALVPMRSVIVASTSNIVYPIRNAAVSQGFGGVTPEKFGIYLAQNTGASLNSSGNVLNYRGIYMTAA